MEQDEAFDWGELSREWWLETAATCGASERHAMFAAAKHRGAANAAAARAAGFGAGNDASARSEGYRLARSNRIMSLLALAVAKAGGGCGGLLTPEESRRILTGLARGSDPALKIKAIESLNKLDKDERAERSRDDGATDVAGIVRQILADMGSEGALSAAELWYFASGGNLLTCPGFELIAPVICRRFPDCWQRYRAPLLKRVEHFKGSEREQAFLDKFDAAGLAPEPSEPAFRALVMDKGAVHRGNGAATPELLLEQTGDVENAAA
jgi:hypothetical protein